MRKSSRSVLGGEIRVYAVRVSTREGGMDWTRDSRVESVKGSEYASAREELL